MRTARFATVAALLGLFAAGCKKGDALVVVHVSSTLQIDNIASYVGTATAAGKHADIMLPVKGNVPGTLNSATTFSFGIRVPVEDVGPFMLTLSAHDAMGKLLQTQTNATETSPGTSTPLDITFGVVNTDLGGGDLDNDAATCPMTCEEAGVGCGKVTTVCGMMLTCPKACSLNAIEPAAARVGDTITLEGRFGTDTTVTFNGGATAQATLLGPERATVTIPNGAISGAVTVSVSGTQGFGATPLKITSFPLGLQAWSNAYPQTDAARLMPQLQADRSLHATVAVGHTVVVFGGQPGNGGPTGTPLNTIEVSDVNMDGTLGPFYTYQTSGAGKRTLETPRAAMCGLAVGGSVFAIGGWNGADGGTVNIYNSVERADINGDGTGIQGFATAVTTLNTGRYLAACTIIGDYVYVFGGFTSGSIGDPSMPAMATATIERAPILANGLGPFEVVPTTLSSPRGGAGVAVIGKTVYVIGGLTGLLGGTKTMEKATINGDGSLGTFTELPEQLDDVHAAFATTVMGGKVYLVGGIGTNPAKPGMPDNVPFVSVADIQANDMLGSFTKQSGVMTRPRAAFGQGVLVGNNYYVIGGGGGMSSTQDVEYSSINASGDNTTWTTLSAQTGSPHTGAASIVVRDHLYLFGGTPGGQKIESAQIQPDGSIGSFSILSPTLSTPRSGAAVAYTGGVIYVYGGGTTLTSADCFQVNQDGSLMASGTGAPALTVGRQNFTMLAVANPNGGAWMYAIGGDGSGINIDKTTERAALDPNGNLMGSFATAATLANPHSNFSQAYIGGIAYLFGELNSSSSTMAEASAVDSSGNLGTFNPTGTAVMTHGRWGTVLLPTGPRMLLAGGYNGSMPDSAVDQVGVVPFMGVIQPAGMYTPLSTPLMVGRRAPVGAAVGNYLYVIGGYNNTDLNTIERSMLK